MLEHIKRTKYYEKEHCCLGNWKMNTTVPEGVELAKAVVEKISPGS